tara:strand:- start:701 stop:1159 length:459 start_codon:yes stop_codon:yes gene_type:complete
MGYDGSASVDFKDSANNAIACNYFSVDCRSQGETDGGYFIVQPSGVYGVDVVDMPEGANSVSSPATPFGVGEHADHHVSAGCGGVIGTADGSVEMSLASTDKTLGIYLINKLDDTHGPGGASMDVIFVVTYGNMKQANPQRDQDNTFYPPGS